MPEESTTPDLIELSRHQFEAANRHDADAVLSNYVPDAVWDLSDAGMGVFEGIAAIRAFFEDWWETWGEHVIELEEVADLGHGVMFSCVHEDGRLAGSDAHVEQRRGWITLWAQEKIERVTVYLDIDEARAAAERLAKERGLAMSENLDLVRSIYAAWERGDYYSSVEWAHPEIEFVVMDGPSPGGLTGVAAVEDNWREFQRAWADYRIKTDEYRQLDDDRVLVLVRFSGRGKTSGLEMGKAAANIFTIRFGRVTRLVIYWDRETALGDLGLKG